MMMRITVASRTIAMREARYIWITCELHKRTQPVLTGVRLLVVKRYNGGDNRYESIDISYTTVLLALKQQ